MSDKCKHCGACKECGAHPYQPQIIYVYPQPVNPYSRPYWQGTTYSVSGGYVSSNSNLSAGTQ